MARGQVITEEMTQVDWKLATTDGLVEQLRKIRDKKAGWTPELAREVSVRLLLSGVEEINLSEENVAQIILQLQGLPTREEETEVELKSVALNSEQLKQLLAELDDAKARTNPEGEVTRLAKKHGWAKESIEAVIAQKMAEQRRLEKVLEDQGLDEIEARRRADRVSDTKLVMAQKLVEEGLEIEVANEVVVKVVEEEVLPQMVNRQVGDIEVIKLASRAESAIRAAGIKPEKIEAAKEVIIEAIVVAKVEEMAHEEAKIMLSSLNGIENLAIERQEALAEEVSQILLTTVVVEEESRVGAVAELIGKEVAVSGWRPKDESQVAIVIRTAEMELVGKIATVPQTHQVYVTVAMAERMMGQMLAAVPNPDVQTVVVAREVVRMAAEVYHQPAAEVVMEAYPAAVGQYQTLDSKIYPRLSRDAIKQRGRDLRMVTGWMASKPTKLDPRPTLEKIEGLRKAIDYLESRGVKIPPTVRRISEVGNLISKTPNATKILAGGGRAVRFLENMAGVDKFLGKIGLDKLAGKVGLKVAEKFGLNFLKQVGIQGISKGVTVALASALGLSVPVVGWIITAAVWAAGIIKGFMEKHATKIRKTVDNILEILGLPNLGRDARRWIENTFGDNFVSKTLGTTATWIGNIFTAIGLITVPSGIVMVAIIVAVSGPIINMIINVSPYISALVPPKGIYQQNVSPLPIVPTGPIPLGCPNGWPLMPSDIPSNYSSIITQYPYNPISGSSHHGANAIDISLSTGHRIVATHGGRAYRYLIGMDPGRRYYGSFVEVKSNCDGREFSTIYAHFLDIPGETFNSSSIVDVSPGTILGYSDNTGNSTGAHLHYEIRNLPYLITYYMGI